MPSRAQFDQPPDRIEVLTLGEPLVALVADRGSPMADVDRFRRHVTGAEVNVAVGLARLGHRVGFVGRIGNDGLGLTIERRLRSEGVDMAGIQVDAAGWTGMLIRERRALGPSEVIYRRAGSAGAGLRPEDLDASGGLRGARWLHVTGITPALSGTAAAAVGDSIELARAAGATVSFDVNFRERLWPRDRASEALARIARQADLVFGDADELALCTGVSDPAARLHDDGVRLVVTKMGSSGAMASDRSGRRQTVAAMPVANPVDPVGAGDAFCAGFIAAELEGFDLSTALAWGAACGAASVAVPGDNEGLPSRNELDRLLEADGRTTLR
jgi:2-dehydro-3-deoxygluconokinase